MRKGGTKLSRTIRKRYTGALVRDGQWTHRCPERNCDWCVRGRAKRAWNRKQRRDARDLVRVEHDGPVWVSESMGEAVQGVVDAWCDEGTHPAYHRAAQARLERQWPVLYLAIQELVKSNVIR